MAHCEFNIAQIYIGFLLASQLIREHCCEKASSQNNNNNKKDISPCCNCIERIAQDFGHWLLSFSGEEKKKVGNSEHNSVLFLLVP